MFRIWAEIEVEKLEILREPLSAADIFTFQKHTSLNPRVDLLVREIIHVQTESQTLAVDSTTTAANMRFTSVWQRRDCVPR